MNCRLVELRHKEVIDKSNGCKIGFVDDLVVDTNNAQVCSLIVFGRCKWFGLWGKREEYIIPWDKISVIGDDTILISSCNYRRENNKNKRGFFRNFQI